MTDEIRASLAGGLWFVSALVLVAIFISSAAQGVLTPAHLIFATVILALALAGTFYILRMGSGGEKAKRGVDHLLHDLNEDDLLELKQRLADVEPPAAKVVDHVGDDGELVWRE